MTTQIKRRNGKQLWCWIIVMFIFAASAFAWPAEDEGWPREIETPKGTVVIYQPQPETFKGNELTARAAVSVKLKDEIDPLFGAIWTTSRVETDREARTVSILDVHVDNVRFPDATPEQAKKLSNLLETEIPKWHLNISLDRLTATLAAVEKEQKAAENFSTTPPKIIFSKEPAVLVTIDGQPELRKIEKTSMMRVINSPFPIILEPKSKTYYLSGGEVWYKAADPVGPWQYIQQPPKEVAALVQTEEDARASSGASEESTKIPRIVVSTEPADLIVADGEPKYSPISGTDLLYMSNTESDILLEIMSQNHYVLLSGRWFSSSSLEGPWTYVAADKLPESFAKIPHQSANGHLLTFVAGTDQAHEAVMDSQIPQTSTINRKDASLEVTYDGTPKFEKVEGTDMEYAVNTSSSVMKIGNKYYCCQEAVWYEADGPTGPWIVSVKVPPDVQEIPPSNPNYNVKYVYIYDSTPDVVYIGYTPAYMGSYVYGPCMVYGTGYHYNPWMGPAYYYPHHSTWGFHVRYNPWYGWSFGMSYSSGPFRMTVGFGGHGGWYGPGPYRHYPHRSYHKTNINVNRNININTGNINIGSRNTNINRNNIYNRTDNRKRNVPRSGNQKRVQPQVARDKPNNVFADKNGNVHRRTDKGWENRDKGQWSKPESGTRDRGNVQKSKPDWNRTKPQMERDYQGRQRGNQRAQQAPRGGGGRRRR